MSKEIVIQNHCYEEIRCCNQVLNLAVSFVSRPKAILETLETILNMKFYP